MGARTLRLMRECALHLLIAVVLGVVGWLHETRGLEALLHNVPEETRPLVRATTERDAFQLMMLLWILQGAITGVWALFRLRDEVSGVSALAQAVGVLEGHLKANAQLRGYPALIRDAVDESSIYALGVIGARELVINDFMLSGLWYREFWERLAEAQDRLRAAGKSLVVRITQGASAAGSTSGPWSGRAGSRLVEIQAEMVSRGGTIMRIFVGRPADAGEQAALEVLRWDMEQSGIRVFEYQDADAPTGDFLWLDLKGIDDDGLGEDDIVVRWFYSGSHVGNSRVVIGDSTDEAHLWRRMVRSILKGEVSEEDRELLEFEGGVRTARAS